APSRARRSAIARPLPRAAPVTTATFPSICIASTSREADRNTQSSPLSTALTSGCSGADDARAMSPPKKTVEPQRLTRDRIVDEALALVDREGADALTLRNLGAALGVDPTAVYRHFRDK